MTTPRSSAPKVYLLASDDDNPTLRLQPGKRYDVSITTMVDSDLKTVSDETEGNALAPARLCGGRSTCVAIVETE